MEVKALKETPFDGKLYHKGDVFTVSPDDQAQLLISEGYVEQAPHGAEDDLAGITPSKPSPSPAPQ